LVVRKPSKETREKEPNITIIGCDDQPGFQQIAYINTNVLLRVLLVEAAPATVRSQPQWRSQFFHLAMLARRKIAKFAMARKLAVQLYWMWRRGWV
jgi:hypothetical protein